MEVSAMEFERNRLYDAARHFFEVAERSAMKLSADAAIAVCKEASNHGLVVSRIEGGVWHNPGFEARLDCIWDGVDPPLSAEEAEVNNVQAIDFICRERDEHGAFIITAPPITGWPHTNQIDG